MIRTLLLYWIALIIGLITATVTGLSLALSSGGYELTLNEILTYFIFFSSLIHASIFSWLFIWHPKLGSILGMLGTITCMIFPVVSLFNNVQLKALLIILIELIAIILYAFTLLKPMQKVVIIQQIKWGLSILAPAIVSIILILLVV